ncbi:hypothetical protein pwc_34 [Weissella phage PWc]|nr:hypothetical protein pwc_34 [Weissella phage PWc]
MAYVVIHKDNTTEVVQTLQEAKDANGVRYERYFEKGDAIKNEPPAPLDDLTNRKLSNEMFMSVVEKQAKVSRIQYKKDYNRFVALYEQGHTLEEIGIVMDKSISTLSGNRYRYRYKNSKNAED